MWTKDSTTHAPLVVFTRAELGPNGERVLIYNPSPTIAGAHWAVVHERLGDRETMQEVEALLESDGGVEGL